MKVVRYFIHADSENTGMVGYVPLWVPRSANFDPVSGMRGTLHDCLEHRLCDTGKPHEEAMAFGRLMAIRVTSNAADGRTNGNSLGAEFAGVLRDALCQTSDEYAVLPTSPGIGRLFDWNGRAEIHSIVKACHKTLKTELENEDGIDMPGPEFFTRLAHWLSIGFIDAHRRYGGSRGLDEVGSLFQQYQWNEKNDPIDRILGNHDDHNGDGSCLRVTIDTEEGEVKLQELHADDEFDRHPQWLRNRIRHWRTA